MSDNAWDKILLSLQSKESKEKKHYQTKTQKAQEVTRREDTREGQNQRDVWKNVESYHRKKESGQSASQYAEYLENMMKVYADAENTRMYGEQEKKSQTHQWGVTRKRSEDSDEILTKAERRKLKKRYEEIRDKEKEEQKIKDAYMKVKNFDKSRRIKKAAQQALKKIDKILDNSSTGDQKKRRTENQKVLTVINPEQKSTEWKHSE